MRYIQLRTPIPGPKAQAWLERLGASVPRALAPYVPTIIERAEGSLVYDVDGNRLIDMSGGIGVLNVGHTAPAVVSAICDQAHRYLHTDFSVLPYAPYIELAERLASLVPGSGPKKVAFFNSGAEAVENAIKIARAATGRPGVIAFSGAFHGRTLLALTMTSKVKPYKKGFGPFAPEVYRAPYPYCYRCPLGKPYPDCGMACAEQLEAMFTTHVDPEQVAAVVIEPVQGEGGFVVPPGQFLLRLQAICRSHGILFVCDEIQTGFGRTGRLFACEHWDLDPDLLVVGKAIAGGLPLSAVIGKAHLMDAPEEGGIGGTFVGNPVACAAGLAVLETMEQKDLIARSRRLGEVLRSRFEAMQRRFSIIGDVRGLGSMMAIELVRDRNTKEPADTETSRILAQAVRRGAIFLKAGVYGNVIRTLAPLTTPEDQLNEALDVLEAALTQEASGP